MQCQARLMTVSIMHNDLPIHTESLASIKKFAVRPSHALILASPSKEALLASVEHLASTVLEATIPDITDYPSILILPKEKKAISIEEIREIQQFIKLKTIGSNNIRRLICIFNAENMSIEAQNALLKILEEPPIDTLLIIATSSYDSLLPTIRSRAQSISVSVPTVDQYTKIYGNETEEAISRAYLMSDGLPEIMRAIINSEDNDVMSDIQQAKAILSGSAYDRLILIDAISKNKKTAECLKALENMCHAALNQAAQKDSPSTKQWVRKLNLVLLAERDITYNVSPKIVLTDLFLKI